MLNGDAHQFEVEELRIRPVALSKTKPRRRISHGHSRSLVLARLKGGRLCRRPEDHFGDEGPRVCSGGRSARPFCFRGGGIPGAAKFACERKSFIPHAGTFEAGLSSFGARDPFEAKPPQLVLVRAHSVKCGPEGRRPYFIGSEDRVGASLAFTPA